MRSGVYVAAVFPVTGSEICAQNFIQKGCFSHATMAVKGQHNLQNDATLHQQIWLPQCLCHGGPQFTWKATKAWKPETITYNWVPEHGKFCFPRASFLLSIPGCLLTTHISRRTSNKAQPLGPSNECTKHKNKQKKPCPLSLATHNGRRVTRCADSKKLDYYNDNDSKRVFK